MSISIHRMDLIESNFSKKDLEVFNIFKDIMISSCQSMVNGPLRNYMVALAKTNYFKGKYFVVKCQGDENTRLKFDSRKEDWAPEIWDGCPTEEDKKKYLDQCERMYKFSIYNPEFMDKIQKLKKLTKGSEMREFCNENEIPICTESRILWTPDEGYMTTCEEHTDYVLVYGGNDVVIGYYSEEY